MFRRLVLAAALLPVVSGRVVGDSMFSNNAVKGHLEQYAGGITIENSAQVGASFHDGWVPSIPSQYSWLNIRDNPPITAIVDGGGNDVMSVKDDCTPKMNDRCKQQITEALDIAEKLLEKMDEDGIAHIVFMGPFYVVNLDKAVDYAYPKLRQICTNNKKIDCHLVDTRKVDPPKPADGDHIHPNEEGYKMLADAIWEVIQDNNIPMK